MTKKSLFMSVLNRGKAGDFLNEMRVLGLTGGTILLGEGTASNKLLRILGLDETQKEIVFLPPIEEEYVDAIHDLMLDHFRMNKKRKGIAFSIPLSHFRREAQLQEGEVYDPQCFEYQCIFVVVNEGDGKEVIQKAQQLGQRGGTIIHGRGAGIPSDAYFPFSIEPQKDVVMLLVKSGQALGLQSDLFQSLQLEQPGKGIMFTLPVSKVTGSFVD